VTEPQPEAEPELAYAPSPAPTRETRSAQVQRKSWSEQRAERRRRRVWLEEVLAWILVPVIVLGSWWFIDMVLAALGTSPAAILNGLSAVISAL
jgi:hypothetical protein